MNMTIDETGANYAIKISLYMPQSKLLYQAILNADVALLRQKVIAINYGSLEKDLMRWRHLLAAWPGEAI